MQDDRLVKYPRTPHIEGSRLQMGDEDLRQVPFSEIAGRHLVVEEKIDGANSAVSFTSAGEMRLQSRGHFLVGGYREKHYDLFKLWGAAQRDALWRALGSRYVMYGEWMYAKHSIYYDALPHYFMEFDVLDRDTGRFLDTPSRRMLLKGLPVCSVPVLAEGAFDRLEDVLACLGDSRFITADHIAHLRAAAEQARQDADLICRQTDHRATMEGLYIKAEEDGEVKQRVKYVRGTFLQVVEESQSHWLERPIIPNGLTRPVEDLFLPALKG